MKSIRLVAVVCLCALILVSTLNGQSVTGQISGSVADATGGAIAAASVTLTHELSQQVRSFPTDSNGRFIFTNLVPGEYILSLNVPGFKAYQQKGIVVSTQERVNLNEIRLAVGDVTTTVEVQSQAVRVATDSSDRTFTMSSSRIEDLHTRGRNPLTLIQAFPGVQSAGGGNDFRGWSGGGIPAVNGGRTGQVQLNLDGIASQDSGNLNPGYSSPSIDAINEVTLVVSNYQAEYGGRTGGQLILTVKNGTPKYHGSAYYYLRHEMFNANEFFSNKQNVQKARYRYQNPGGTIGGPLLIPGTGFNKSRQKLFFFFSADYLRNRNTIDNTFTMPSALERQGDFSKTVTTTGAVVSIFDPTTKAQFPGNIIPASRINPAGQAMLNLFPLPHASGLALDTSGTRAFNFRNILQQMRPNEDKILRIDYNLSSRTTTFVRLLQDYQAVDGYAGTVGPAGGNWGQFPHSYHVQAAGAVGTVVHTFSPSLVGELTWGINRGRQGVNPLDNPSSTAEGGTKTYADAQLPLKDSAGKAIPLPRIFAGSNSLNLLPQVNFGFPSGFSAQSPGQTISRAPQFGHDPRWPFVGTDSVQSISGKFTWIKGSHNVKAGYYMELMARNVSVYSTYNVAGSYYFGSDRSADLDTGYPYSNALLGSIFAYGDDNKKQINHARYKQIEWFVQDAWKVRRGLTLDLGLRFHRVGDLYSQGGTLGLFAAEDYSASKAGQLLFPGCSIATTAACPTANRIAVNPKTGATFPYVRQGTFDNASFTGATPFSGIRYYDSHFFKVPPIRIGPRAGFAWDVFGDGKTALRGGFGITVGRNWTVDNIGATGAGRGPLTTPPNFQAPIVLYTSFQNLTGSQAFYTPQDVLGGSRDEETQTTYNWSFGIQRDLGHGLFADVAYVGNALRHGYGQAIDFNAVAPLTTWNPRDGQIARFRDPTSTGFYSTNLIRSMVGYAGLGQIPIWTYLGTSSYNALQMQLNKRSGHLQWAANYTWSKTIIYNFDQFVDGKLGKNVTNRPHVLNFNVGYDIPGIGRFWRNAFTKHAFDDWNISGSGAIFSGSPYSVGCTAQGQPAGYWTGTPTGGIPFRCQMGDAIYLPDGRLPSATEDPGLQVPFNAANFQLPGINSLGIGNTPPTLRYGPGLFNLDLSLSKNFRIGESRSLEFRVETFNTTNHFNPNNPNTGLTYNFASGAQTNASFGLVQGAQLQARRGIMSLRFRF